MVIGNHKNSSNSIGGSIKNEPAILPAHFEVFRLLLCFVVFYFLFYCHHWLFSRFLIQELDRQGNNFCEEF